MFGWSDQWLEDAWVPVAKEFSITVCLYDSSNPNPNTNPNQNPNPNPKL